MLGELLAMGAALCFAIAATIYMKPLAKLGAASASILRFVGTGAILILVVMLVWGPELIFDLPIQIVLLSIASGVVGLTFGDVLYMHSFKTIGVARTVSLVGTYPLFTLVIEFAIGRGNIPVLALVGTPMIILGIWLLMNRNGETRNTGEPQNRKGIAAGLTTSFLYSVSMLFVDEALSPLSSGGVETAFAINALRTIAGGLGLLLFAPVIDRKLGFLRMSREAAALLLVGSIIAYGIGWYFLTVSFTLAPAAIVVPLSAITPLFAAISAVLYLHEPLNKPAVLGILTTVTGIILIVLA